MAGVIVSDPAIGVDRYGLTARGKQQALEVRVSYGRVSYTV